MSYLNYLEVLVLIVPGPVVGVPLLEGVPVHRVGGDVPAGNTNVNYSQRVCTSRGEKGRG